MSELASTPPHEKKNTIPRKLLSRKDCADIATQQAATVWQPHSAHAALSGLGKTGYGISRAHPAPLGGITNNCITSDPGRTR